MSNKIKLKIPEMKKQLKEYEQKELIQIIADLYKLNQGTKDYLHVKLMGEKAVQELFDDVEEEVEEEFFPLNGFGKMRLAKAKKAISNFKKITGDSVKALDLTLFYVEIGTEFTNTYGDIDGKFYDSMVSMYYKVVTECKKDEKLFNQFKDRLELVVEDSDGIGWGYHDDLKDLYHSIEFLKG